jgi:hypothetical protein
VRLAAVSYVTGRVTAAGGGPIAGAVVLARDASKGMTWYYGDLLSGWGEQTVVRAVTDEDGRFRVALPAGAWALIARFTGCVDDFAVVTVPSADAVAIALRPATTLTGILGGDDGRPLAGAVVVLDPSAEVRSPRISIPSYDPDRLQSADHLLLRHTDAAGAFGFPDIPEASYALIVVIPTATSQPSREVRFGPLRPAAGPYELTLAAPRSNALSGRVVDAGGAAFRDARISIVVIEEKGPSNPGDPRTWPRQSQAFAAADGSFLIDALTATSYTLQVNVMSDKSEAKLADRTKGTYYGRSQNLVLHGVRPPRTDLVLEVTEMPRLRGRLVDEARAPLGGWTVTTDSGSDRSLLTSSALTREDGTFEIRDVEDADYALTVRLDGRPPRRVVLPRPARGGAALGDVVATLEARIRGSVVDAKGSAVAGAAVTLYPTAGGLTQAFTTGTDGAFEATGLDPAVRYNVYVIGADGRRAAGTSAASVEGVRPGTDDLRLVRE